MSSEKAALVCAFWAIVEAGQADRLERGGEVSCPQADTYIRICLGYIAHRGSIRLLVDSRVI